MNIGYEDEELKPFIEPEADFNDPVRIGNSSVWMVHVTAFCLYE